MGWDGMGLRRIEIGIRLTGNQEMSMKKSEERNARPLGRRRRRIGVWKEEAMGGRIYRIGEKERRGLFPIPGPKLEDYNAGVEPTFSDQLQSPYFDRVFQFPFLN